MNEKQMPARIWIDEALGMVGYINEPPPPESDFRYEYVRADLLATARKEAFKEARHRVYMISGSTNVDPSVRKGFAAGVQAAIEVIAALERAATTDKENK